MRPPVNLAVVLASVLVACASSPRVEDAHGADATPDAARPAVAPPAAPDATAVPAVSASTTGTAASTVVDAGPPAGRAPVKVKVVTIGMHVAGGPFDEPTKEPFKRAVEPRFPEIAQCWGKHVPSPPKQADVGVDLLIEAAGGHPKVSNPRSTLGKGAEYEAFVSCVIAVFETVEFPKLDRGRTGVSYSLRFTLTA